MRTLFHRGPSGRFSGKVCVFLLLFATLVCSACGAAPSAGAPDGETGPKPGAAAGAQSTEDEGGAAVNVPFQLVAVPAGGYDSEQVLPLARALASPEDLAGFYGEYREQFSLDGQPGGNSFAAQMKTYDDAYFADHLLVVALFEMTNGAQSITPEALTAEDGKYVLSVVSETGGMGTTALEYSAWFLEIDQKNGVLPVEIRAADQS